MPIFFGVNHDIPKKSPCRDCGKSVRLDFLDECTVQGKFLVFMGVCRSCGAIKWNFAGESEYIRNFMKMMDSPEFERILPGRR